MKDIDYTGNKVNLLEFLPEYFYGEKVPESIINLLDSIEYNHEFFGEDYADKISKAIVTCLIDTNFKLVSERFLGLADANTVNIVSYSPPIFTSTNKLDSDKLEGISSFTGFSYVA